MYRDINARALSIRGWVGACVLLIQSPVVAATTARQLVEVVDINNVSVSPDGQQVAFRTEQASIERNTHETVWYVQPVDGSAPARRVGDGGDILPDGGGSSLPEPVQWSADGHWIFFRAVHDGRIDLWRAGTDGSRTERLTRDDANVRTFVLAPDGRSIDYSIGPSRLAVADAEQDQYDHGFHIDRDISLGDGLFRSAFHEGRLATQRLSNSVEFVMLLADVPARWKRLDLSTGQSVELTRGAHLPTPITGSELEGIPGQAIQVAEQAGSGRLAVISEQSGKHPAETHDRLLMLGDRRSRSPVQCQAPACTDTRVTGVAWRPGSEEVVFTVSERDSQLQQSIYRWNVVNGEVIPVIRSRGQVSGGGRWWPAPCATSTSALLCVASEADAPPRLERIDMGTGARTVLYAPNQVLALDMQGVPARPLVWTDAQGHTVTGQFFPALGKQGKPPPLFVVYYRCSGFLRGGVGDEWPLATFAQAGIAALCINAMPSDEDAVVRYNAGLEAVRSAIALLAGRGEIDPDRVGMGGLSLGAEVTLWVALHSDLLRATSISTPVISPNMSLLLSLGEGTHFTRMQRYWQVGEPGQTQERWRVLSPMTWLGRMRAPALMQMSEQEYRYALDYAIPLIRQHRADLYVFPNEPHQKFQPRHKLAVYQRNLDWFRFWLLGEQDDDRAKSMQYAAWRQMADALQASGR